MIAPSPTMVGLCLACALVCAWLAHWVSAHSFSIGLLVWALAGFWLGAAWFEARQVWQYLKTTKGEQA